MTAGMFIEAPELSAHAGVRHAFFTRVGGVSEGLYASLNGGLGSQDAPERVAENRARMCAQLGLPRDRLVSLYQVHSADVVTVEAPFAAERPKADAMVTRIPGLALGIATADCGPILFADPENGVVGAAHAGWKGALTGVIGATVSAMEALGARRSRIVAVLGPTIGQASYEVGPDFVARFGSDAPGMERFLGPGTRPGTPSSIFRASSWPGSARPRSARPPHSISAPTPIRSGSTATGGPRIAARRITAA